MNGRFSSERYKRLSHYLKGNIMKEKKIKSITVLAGHGRIGLVEVNKDVKEIKDISTVNSSIYEVYDHSGNPMRTIINCPVDIEYF